MIKKNIILGIGCLIKKSVIYFIRYATTTTTTKHKSKLSEIPLCRQSIVRDIFI